MSLSASDFEGLNNCFDTEFEQDKSLILSEKNEIAELEQELSDSELAKKLSTQKGGNTKNFKYKYLKYKMKYLNLR